MNKKVVFLPYDMDTAIGINNEGALVFSYNLEDTDQVGNADVFNGQQSVLWCNLRDMFGTELREMYQQLRSTGALSYEKVERMFEEHQAKWPEAIFNEDAFFKYIQPLIDDNDRSYLSMLQGSKAEQRKWWLYNRFKYMDSKFNCGDALTDFVQLRGYAKSSITITPYADIYIGIKWGSMLRQQRGTRNTAYTMACPLDNINDTEIYIYSSSQMSSLGDLSGLKVGFADFHNATKLQDLILGSTAQGYTNPNLRSINVGNLRLLKKIDARNCTGLGNYADQSNVDLSGCTGIEEVYFDGTNIKGVELPNGGFLKKLHLPGTITNLTVRNQTRVTEFVCPDMSHVSTLYLEANGNSFDVGNIVDHVASGCRVRIFNYRWDFQNIAAVHTFLDKFDGMIGMDQNGENTEHAEIFATVHVPNATGDEIDSVTARYPDITVDADVASYYVRYYDYDGTTLLYTETVPKGQNGSYAGTASHDPTAQYTYVFAGWNSRKNSSSAEAGCRDDIQGNTNVYAAFSTSVRTYTITFVRAQDDGGGTLQTSQVAYGSMPSYTGATPTTTKGADIEFKGWRPNLSTVTGDQTYTAKFAGVYDGLTRMYVVGLIDEVELSTVSMIRDGGFKGQFSLKTALFPSVTSVGSSAFRENVNLSTVSLPIATYLGDEAFYSCTGLRSISLPSVSYIGSYAFYGCRFISTISFPNAIEIGNMAFYGLYQLTSLNFPLATSIGSNAFGGCTSISTISFPCATALGNSAFYNCRTLTTASFSLVTSIGDSAFANCSSMTEVTFDLLEVVSYCAFMNCHSLATVSFPNAWKLSHYAFAYCSALTIVSFPVVSYIGPNAFSNCRNLTKLILGYSSVAQLGGVPSYIFYSTSADLHIYVPDNLVEGYRVDSSWAVMSSRIKGFSDL